MTPEEILCILRDVLRLKEVDREGWKRRGIRSPERVAGHTSGVAFLAMAMAEIEGLDVKKSLEMAILHDLPESRIGDIDFHSPRYKDKERMEQDAAREILGGVPDYFEIWHEYYRGETPEAQLVRAADKLELLAQALEYEKRGCDVDEFWEEEYLFSGVAESIYNLLKASRG
jgi:putative hydrolase of HD superfamily